VKLWRREKAYRYLVIHDNGALLLHDMDGRITRVDKLTQSESDTTYLSDLVSNDPQIPFTIIVDCFDEEFKQSNITHVGSMDSRAILDRKLVTLFRASNYRYSAIVGREDSGRRDDRAVFSALIQPKLIDQWVEAIVQRRGQIIAITSASYLTELWAERIIPSASEARLLISFDWFSGLRSTFLKNGKVQFSRQVQRDVSSSDQLLQLVKDQAKQTRKYLESIKLITYEDDLECILISAAEDINTSAVDLTPRTTLWIHSERHHEHSDIYRSLFFSAFTYSSIKLFELTRASINRYATPEITRFYSIKRTSSIITSLGLGLSMISLAVAMPSLIAIYLNYSTIRSLEVETSALNRDYQTMRERFPEAPIGSGLMQTLVEIHDLMSQTSFQYLTLLERFSAQLSKRPDIMLSNLSWSIFDRTQTQFNSDITLLETNSVELVLNDRYGYVLQIDAEVERTSNLMEVNQKILSFADQLSANAGFEVSLLELPVDVDPGASVSLELDGSELTSSFSMLIWESPSNAVQDKTD
jgi:hypothetical protein